MNKGLHLISMMKNQRGVTAIVAVIVVPMLIGFIALAVDVGYLYATRNELQNVADSAALAAARKLGSFYQDMSYTEQKDYSVNEDSDLDGKPDSENITDVARAVALENRAANVNIDIDPADVEIGKWTGSPPLVVTSEQPDAVKVKARRDSGINGTIATFFARIFKIFGGDHDTMSVSAYATAALTGPAKVDPGKMNLPIGLSERQFDDPTEDICSEEITFSPTTESCAGWHNFFDKINASAMNEKLIGFIRADNSDYYDDSRVTAASGETTGEKWLNAYFEMNKTPDAAVTDETKVSDFFEFQGGTVSSLFIGGKLDWEDDGEKNNVVMKLDESGNPIMISDPKHPASFTSLFDYFRFRDGDENDSIWTTTAPVYKDNDDTCINPNNALKIVGFATVRVSMPNPPPDSTVTVTVDCDFTLIDGRGGGGTYGNLKGAIPNLVE